nr:hypothetical protein [Tanacetum cinerariifolium]
MNQPGIKEDIHCKNSKLEGGNNQKYDQPGLKEDHNNEGGNNRKKMINMDTMKITATKVEITKKNKDDLPGYKNDHKHYSKSDGGFNQKMDQEDLKTYTAAFVIRGRMLGQYPITQINPKPAEKHNRSQTGQNTTQLSKTVK